MRRGRALEVEDVAVEGPLLLLAGLGELDRILLVAPGDLSPSPTSRPTFLADGQHLCGRADARTLQRGGSRAGRGEATSVTKAAGPLPGRGNGPAMVPRYAPRPARAVWRGVTPRDVPQVDSRRSRPGRRSSPPGCRASAPGRTRRPRAPRTRSRRRRRSPPRGSTRPPPWRRRRADHDLFLHRVVERAGDELLGQAQVVPRGAGARLCARVSRPRRPRWSSCATSSSIILMASVGQASAQRGSFQPSSSRCAQPVHFWAMFRPSLK